MPDIASLFARPRRDKYLSGMLSPPESSIVGLNQFSDNEAGYGVAQPAPPVGASMRSYTPPPSVQAGYDIGAKLDPGTPGDKREVYRQGQRLNIAAGLLAPPIGAAQGLLDLEHATHDYSTGKAGISDVAMAAPGALGIAGKLPRLRGGYHGTSSPDDFSSFIKSNRDMGVHISTDPNVARGYAMGEYSPNKFLSDWATLNNAHPTIPVAGPRTMPVVADIRNPMKYPGDAINWQSADNVVGVLESAIMGGEARSPHYIDTFMDLKHVAGKPGKFEGNFEDYLRGKGYDAVKYPHVTKAYGVPDKFNAFMALDPGQVLPKFSPEGIALAKERGVIRPGMSLQWNPMDQAYWDLKHIGIMGNKKTEAKVDKIVDEMQKGVKFNQDAPYTHKDIAGMLSEGYMAKEIKGLNKPLDVKFSEPVAPPGPGSAAAGIPFHLVNNTVGDLEKIGQSHLLSKKLSDMTQEEYNIYKNSLTNAENIYKQFWEKKKIAE